MRRLGWGCWEIRRLWKAQLISSRRGESAGEPPRLGSWNGVGRPIDPPQGLLVGFGVEGEKEQEGAEMWEEMAPGRESGLTRLMSGRQESHSQETRWTEPRGWQRELLGSLLAHCWAQFSWWGPKGPTIGQLAKWTWGQ